jgi:2-dehydropantoate 2-reductase
MDKTPSLRIVIFGVGAMGTLFGSRLSPLAEVTLVGHWAEQIDTIRRDGLTVTHPNGSRTQHRLRITNNLAEAAPADVALILVKSYQTARAARQAAAVLRPAGLAITLQNGLGNLDRLAEAVGRERAALGITAQGATVPAPGRLDHAGEGPTYLARLPGREQQLEQVAALFNAAGIETSLVNDADSLVWGKLAINAGINPLTALMRVPNGMLVEDETLKRLMAAAATEVAAVAEAQGIHLPFADAAARTAEVARATAANRSSMLQDVSRAGPTEIDAISGAVVRFGRRLGVPTPVNEFLLRQMQARERLITRGAI